MSTRKRPRRNCKPTLDFLREDTTSSEEDLYGSPKQKKGNVPSAEDISIVHDETMMTKSSSAHTKKKTKFISKTKSISDILRTLRLTFVLGSMDSSIQLALEAEAKKANVGTNAIPSPIVTSISGSSYSSSTRSSTPSSTTCDTSHTLLPGHRTLYKKSQSGEYFEPIVRNKKVHSEVWAHFDIGIPVDRMTKKPIDEDNVKAYCCIPGCKEPGFGITKRRVSSPAWTHLELFHKDLACNTKRGQVKEQVVSKKKETGQQPSADAVFLERVILIYLYY